MRNRIEMVLLCFLTGCAGGPSAEQLAAAPRRELTAFEKKALSVSLAQTLKDPASAQFKWMPVTIALREGINDYCGLVNGKNSYGGYTGFQKFYAQLIPDEKGQFGRGLIRVIAADDVTTIAVDGQCEKYGYVDFNVAKSQS